MAQRQTNESDCLENESAPSKDAGTVSFSRFLRIEVTLVVAIAIGIFTLSGYAHLEKYYITLEVPMSRINISTQTLLAYGGASISTLIFAVLFAAALVAVPALILALLEKPGRVPPTPAQPSGLFARLRDRALELKSAFVVVGAVVIAAVVAFIIYNVALQQPSDTGRKSAIKKITKCQEQTLRYKNTESHVGCIVAESDDLFYLIKRMDASETKVTFKPFILPKQGLLISEGTTKSLKTD